MPTDNGWQQPEPNGELAKQFSELKSEPTLSFGQQLVGLTFNPSGDDKVARAKKLCAELADLVHEEFTFGAKSFLRTELYSHTIGEILNAQMNCVKLLTLKY